MLYTDWRPRQQRLVLQLYRYLGINILHIHFRQDSIHVRLREANVTLDKMTNWAGIFFRTWKELQRSLAEGRCHRPAVMSYCPNYFYIGWLVGDYCMSALPPSLLPPFRLPGNLYKPLSVNRLPAVIRLLSSNNIDKYLEDSRTRNDQDSGFGGILKGTKALSVSHLEPLKPYQSSLWPMANP